MFTGVITATGEIAAIDLRDGEGTFRFACPGLDLSGARIGDSIAVNGTCLTVTEFAAGSFFAADVSRETIACTTLGDQVPGRRVNLEPAMRIGDALGGHLVTGHVDGVGVVRSVRPDGESVRLTVEAPPALARYIAQKGSVCVDGTSLTVNAVDGELFELMIVPHTQAETIISTYDEGTRVNIEVDMIARYLERLMQYTAPTSGA
jgi:riboflavin synthase